MNTVLETPTAIAPARPVGAFASWVRRNGFATGLALITIYLVLFPLVRLQILAFEDGGRAFATALAVNDIGKTLLTTLALGVGSLVISIVVGTLLAWFALRLPHRARWLGTIPILPLILPGVAVVIGYAFLFSPQVGYINLLIRALPFVDIPAPEVGLPSGPINIYTVAGIIVVTGIQIVPLVFLFVSGNLKNLNHETIEAAMISGASPARAFLSVVVPLLRPAIVYSSAFGLLLGLGQLTAPAFLGTREGIRVLATEIYRFGVDTPTDFGVAAAIASPLLIAGIIFIITQRLLLRRDFRFVSAGAKGAGRPVKPSRLAAPVIAVYGFITLVLPFGALTLVAFSPFWTAQVDFTKLTLSNFQKALGNPLVIDATVTSLTTSLGAILIALPLGYLLADVLYRRRGNAVVRGILDVIVQVPLGVPAVIFGVGLLYVYYAAPFWLYGSPLLIVITYVVLVLPFTVRMQLTGRMSLGSAYEEAARASGANLLRAHAGVVIPMMRGSLVGASVLMFVILTHEFAASMFVRSKQTQVLGTLLFDQWSRGSYPVVAAIALLLSAVTAAGLLLAVWVGGRESTLDRL